MSNIYRNRGFIGKLPQISTTGIGGSSNINYSTKALGIVSMVSLSGIVGPGTISVQVFLNSFIPVFFKKTMSTNASAYPTLDGLDSFVTAVAVANSYSTGTGISFQFKAFSISGAANINVTGPGVAYIKYTASCETVFFNNTLVSNGSSVVTIDGIVTTATLLGYSN